MGKELKAVGEWIMVKIPEETVSKGGIIVPKGSSTKNAAAEGFVLDIGPDAFSDDSPVKSPQFEVGDKVHIHKSLLLLVGDHVYFVKPNSILGVEK